MADATRPAVDIVPGNGVGKRKRSISEEVSQVTTGLSKEAAHDNKRQKSNLIQHGTLGIAARGESEWDRKVDSPQVREAIESQFSLEILLKHEELRLINQELAKCQTALEQLRRCHLIPYPVTQATVESMYNVSNGTGPGLRKGDNVPQWAPAYGVTDGPYTRHYAKWLIPDPNFDGAQLEWQQSLDLSRAGKTLPEGRATRHGIADGNTLAGKARTQRGAAGQKLQALPPGYPQAKEKVGPCIVKRRDGQVVKLVCIDCKRDNFSSTQGFINHCRIAHHRDFKTHEEAALTSGQPIEIDETGSIIGEEKSPATNGLVHPLIRSTPTETEACASILSRINESLALFGQGKLPGVSSIPTSANTSPVKNGGLNPATPHRSFVSSNDTPHLSSFMRDRGFGGNLTNMVDNAKKRVNFDELSSHGEESDDGETPIQGQIGGLDGADSPPPMRMPARAVMSPAPFGRPGSSKGLDGKPGRKPGISPRLSYATPVINTTAAANHSKPSTRLINSHHDEYESQQDVDGDIEMMGPSLVDLSPNTIASNNAPSLVSDDGEYDEGDDAESASSEDEDEGSDVAEIDIEDNEMEKVVPRTVLRTRSGSGGDSMRLRKEDKHVTFVSPVKEVKERRSRK